MKILVTGTRGVPNIPGGVEKHCQSLYPILVELGLEVTLVRRSCYLKDTNITVKEYKGIKLINVFAPNNKSFEAIVHTFLAVIKARQRGIRIIHIHSIGPSIVIPFARLIGLRVLMTHHGPDYEREKWGKFSKAFLRFGEWCATKFANEIIVISETINSILKSKYGRTDAHLIYNGVEIPQIAKSIDYVTELGLEKGKYVIAVCRFVPEKGLHDLLEAYAQLETDYKLVLVGDADHESEYSLDIKNRAQEQGAVLTGFITGEKLNQIFSHAGLFVMPSYHEGLPIALLEALAYNLKVLVSDIPANKEIGLADYMYFATGDVESLRDSINRHLRSNAKMNHVRMIKEKYNWEVIALQTLGVYQKLGE